MGSGADGCDGISVNKAALEKVSVLISLKFVGSEVVAGKSGDILDILHIPLALELQVVDRHDSLDSLIELIVRKSLLEIYGNKSGLPVVAVDQVGAESDRLKGRQASLGEICKSGDLKERIIRVRFICREESLVVDEVESDPVLHGLEYAHILALPVVVHVEVGDIFHLILDLLLHAGILRNHDSDIIVLRINILGERADNVSQSAGLDERYAPLMRQIKFFFSRLLPLIDPLV